MTGRGAGPTAPPAPAPAPEPTPRPTPKTTENEDCATDRLGYDFAVALDGATTLHWSLVENGAALKAALVVAGGGDDAWMSLGWGDGLMVGTECVISERLDLPRKYELTSYERSGVDAMPERRQTLTGTAAYEEDGAAVAEFTKLISEPGEKVAGRAGVDDAGPEAVLESGRGDDAVAMG